MSFADLFEISKEDTVWDAWLTTTNLLDLLQGTEVDCRCDFTAMRDKIGKIYLVAESHSIDRIDSCCVCGLSVAEHAILKRKILTFFSLQLGILKHFIY